MSFDNNMFFTFTFFTFTFSFSLPIPMSVKTNHWLPKDRTTGTPEQWEEIKEKLTSLRRSRNKNEAESMRSDTDVMLCGECAFSSITEKWMPQLGRDKKYWLDSFEGQELKDLYCWKDIPDDTCSVKKEFIMKWSNTDRLFRGNGRVCYFEQVYEAIRNKYQSMQDESGFV